MKKLLLLLASLAVATACTKPQDNPKPEPKPEPSGEMYLNKTTATMKYGDTIHLDVINAPTNAAISWNIDDDYSIYHIENGVIVAQAIGTQNVVVKANEKVFNCLVTVEKTFDDCVFKTPFMKFGVDSTAVNVGALALDFIYLETDINEDKTVADLYYRNRNVTTKYSHNYDHTVNLVAIEEVQGLTEIMVLVPTEDNAEMNTKFYPSFAERHYYIGETENKLRIFQDKARTYSILVGAYTLNPEKTLWALGCTYINVQEWKPQAAPALVRKAQPMSPLTIVDAPQSVKDALAKQGLRKAIGR